MTTAPADSTPPVSVDDLAKPRRRRRTHPMVLVGTFILTVALLLWGADWVARTLVQNQLSGEIGERARLVTDPNVSDPTVTIHGVVFLPQVFRGRYDRVDITFPELTDGPLRLQDVRAELSGVYVSLRDVVLRADTPVLVEHATEQAFLAFDDLNSYLAETGQTVTVGPSEDGLVLLSGSIRLGDSTVAGSAEARLSAAGDAVAVTPTRLIVESPLAGISSLLLGERFTFLIPLDPLPFGELVTEIDVQETGLLIRAEGNDLVLTS